MARHFPRRHFNQPYRRRRSSQAETTFETAKRYGLIAVASGLTIGFGANAWDSSQKRQAILDALPSGFEYSNCDGVRAAGVAPLYSYERGYSEHMDGDGDGIACEPYHGN